MVSILISFNCQTNTTLSQTEKIFPITGMKFYALH